MEVKIFTKVKAGIFLSPFNIKENRVLKVIKGRKAP